MPIRLRFRSARTVAALAAVILVPAVIAQSPAKKVVESSEDLPRHTYKVPEKPSLLINDPAAFAVFEAAVKKDLVDDLANYDIRDRKALEDYKSVLMSVAMLPGDTALI